MEERFEFVLLESNDIDTIKLLMSSMTDDEFNNLIIEYLIRINMKVNFSYHSSSKCLIGGGIYSSSPTMICICVKIPIELKSFHKLLESKHYIRINSTQFTYIIKF